MSVVKDVGRILRIPIGSEEKIPEAIAELLRAVDFRSYPETLKLRFNQLPANIIGAHMLTVPIRLIWQYDIQTDSMKLHADLSVEGEEPQQ